MPTYDSYCRAPLVDPAYVPLPDSAVHAEGSLEQLIRQALDTVDLAQLSPLDAVLATKLGGYTDLPPMPNLTAAADNLPANPRPMIDAVRAGLMIASAGKNKTAMLQVLNAMRAFTDAMPSIGEGALLSVGADAMRVAAELYRRTGQRFLVTLMERLRAQLPDVSGMFNSFPFQKPFVPETVAEDAMDEASQYYRRMRLLGTGAVTADALSITAAFALFSGSSRDAAASKAGLAALQRYHGMPTGAFSADPYLAGRDPARATDLAAVCAQLEALHDLLSASGDVALAEKMQRIAENAYANLFVGGNVCPGQALNRFTEDDTCAAKPAAPAQTAALLRAAYALRRSVWMLRNDSEISWLLPYESCCLTRMDGTPVRVSAQKTGSQTWTLTLEVKQPTEFTLSIHVPGYAHSAALAVNGGKPQTAECGKLNAVKRMYQTGDTVTLTLDCQPFVETGYRGSVSVHCGALLMALPLPEGNAGWQYALAQGTALGLQWENDRPRVQVDACDAPEWAARGNTIQTPPRGLSMGEAYELTLLPYADTLGRIAAFPQAEHRA
ncbi:MAG TPA: glycoside hydrolase family 127 protein [Candidatus Limiplasma sp.]|nr:glycoside hydrolase family 127 protein [Candidatus Limiplasma sp.]HPS80744.1 glycoside hydrolase family 127 protein [Candidatus Limiplasma sp.]